MKNFRIFAVYSMLISIVLISTVQADVPKAINYQGRLTSNLGAPLDTTVSMDFTIYDDSTGGNIKWSESHASVSVTDGIFNVILGTATAITDTVFDDDISYLGIQVGTDPEISPRVHLFSVGYAIHAQLADTASVALSGPAGQDGWADDGATVRLLTIGDQVGIGTTTPSEKLDVAGNIYASGTIESGSSLIVDGVNEEIRADGGTIGFDDDNLETEGDVRIGNVGSLSSGIKLGIRENLHNYYPLFKIEEEQTLPSDLTRSVFEIYNTGYTYTPFKILGTGTIIQSGGTAKSPDAFDVVNQIGAGPSEATFFNGGNVGIGTDEPGSKLEVAGVIASTTGGFRFPDGTIQVSASTGGGEVPLNPFHESGLLSSDDQQTLNSWIGNPYQEWKLCYKRSFDGGSATTFHSQCDNLGPTVTVIYANGHILGGYADASWNGNLGNYTTCQTSFIFSLTASKVYPLGGGYGDYAIINQPTLGPVFGHSSAPDLYVDLNSGQVKSHAPTYYSSNGVIGSPSNTTTTELLGAAVGSFVGIIEIEVFVLDRPY